jgi:predicted nucleotide-binding protein (sugar kinase/HSP70/actin superfamily)
MTVIGLPRALLYYHHAPLLQAFFSALGMQVVASPPTHRETLARGAARVVGETCLPVKIFCGHVLALAGEVDYVFVPSIHHLHPGTRNCPKLIGLPDLVTVVIPEVPLLTLDVGGRSGRHALAQLGSIWRQSPSVNPLRLVKATAEARSAQQAYQERLLQGVDPPDAISPPRRPAYPPPPAALTVAVVGHPYNLHDEYASQRLIQRLRDMDVRVCTPFGVCPADRWRAVEQATQTPYWTFEDEVVGAAACYLREGVPGSDGIVDGIVTVAAFGCAPDSVMLSVVAQAAHEAGVPYLSIILDEHSGEAGLVTRLEAFVDMLVRRKRRMAR